MNYNEKLYDLIDGYLSGDLDSNELASFQERMKNSQNLKEEVALQKEIKEAALENDIIAFRSVVKEVVSENNELDSKNAKQLFYKVAASISLLLVATIFIYQTYFVTESPEVLFETYFVPYDNFRSVRNAPTESNDLINALEYYDKSEYRKAVNHFLRTNYKEDDLLALYVGISYTYLNKLDSAHLTFMIPTRNPNNLYYYPALYYDGLVYLKQNDFNNAGIIFKELKESDSNPYNQLANKILDQLD